MTPKHFAVNSTARCFLFCFVYSSFNKQKQPAFSLAVTYKTSIIAPITIKLTPVNLRFEICSFNKKYERIIVQM